jgi:hypothetical protein
VNIESPHFISSGAVKKTRNSNFLKKKFKLLHSFSLMQTFLCRQWWIHGMAETPDSAFTSFTFFGEKKSP